MGSDYEARMIRIEQQLQLLLIQVAKLLTQAQTLQQQQYALQGQPNS